MVLSDNKRKVAEGFDGIAHLRDRMLKRNRYYYWELVRFFRYNIPRGSRVMEIGCGIGNVLDALQPAYGVGVDISEKMIMEARERYPGLIFYQMDAENLVLEEKEFDFIVVSDTLGYLEDIQKFFGEIRRYAGPDTRVILTYHNFFWQPIIKLAEWLRLKMKQEKLNWLNEDDISNLLYLENFEIIKKGNRILFPKHIPLISYLFNKYVANLPLLNRLCLVHYVVARKIEPITDKNRLSTTVVIPARNESGNIENALKRMPQFGRHMEIVFIEGNSTDDTLNEIKRVCDLYKDRWDIKYAVQDGKGKGDAVRKGFAMARGDILMILDADLTVPPEDLPKFYDAIVTGKGEYINGCRLVYPMEDEAMRTLNVIGNKFFSVMFSYLLGQRLKDTLCGTKVLTRKNYQKLIANRGYFGDFDPFGDFDLIFGSAKLNLKIVEVPIRYKTREYGDTNISRFTHGWLLLKMVIFAMNKIKFI
ncbi:glycosyltransferase [Candidatus Uhrbacteria bacterium]|nr:glycosyltransferase [Candidatus Uhrbacteria bacterium]